VGIRDGQITHLDLEEVVAGTGPAAPSHDAGAGEMDRFFRAPKD
jgi:hypothetical protein